MLRYVYKFAFIPRFPHCHASIEGSFVEEGSYYLVSSKELLMSDFKISYSQITDGCRIHISKCFESFINQEQEKDISFTHSQISTHLTHNFQCPPFVGDSIYILPIMQLKGKTDWDSTILWTKMFVHPPVLSAIYKDLLLKYDKKNNGEKLKSYFVQNGKFVNTYLKFVTCLEIPIHDFVKSNQQVITASLKNSQIIGIYCALRYLGCLIDRVARVDTNKRYTKYYKITGVAFDESISNLSTDYLETFRMGTDMKFDASSPLLEGNLIDVNTEQIFDNYRESIEYPFAVSPRHQRIIELLENKDMIEAVYQRIPSDYSPPDYFVTNIPLEAAFLPPFPKSAIPMLHLVNRVTCQLKPFSPTYPTMQSITYDAAEIIKVHTGYVFQDALLLRTALTDPSLYWCFSGILKGNDKLSFIGDIVIQLIVATAIYGAIPYHTSIECNRIFVQMTGLNFLSNLAVLIGIKEKYITTRSEELVIGSQELKDLFCAVFGAIFLDSSLSSCFKAFKSLLHYHSDILEKYLKSYKNGMSVLQFIDDDFSPKLSCPSPQVSDLSITQEILSQILQFDTKELSSQFFQVALTTPGCGHTSNESFAFIGRAILKFAYMNNANAAFQPSTKEELEFVIMSYLSKSAEFAVKIGISNLLIVSPEYQNFHISHQDELKSLPNDLVTIYAQGFEAMVGCIASTDDLSAAFLFIELRIIGDQWIFMPSDYKNGYIEKLNQLVNDGFKDPNKFPHKIEYTTITGKGCFISVVSIDDKQLPYIGKGVDQIASRYVAAKKVYESFLVNKEIITTKEEVSEEKDIKYFLFS